ncbi:MAG: HAD family phosphatase [Verrucomicrobia bacterium]|nr:HAD family phosphatase [Verrucomicrobiota bacterium]
MKGLLAFDIDGTLTHRLDWIDPKVVQFLKGLTLGGWQLAFLTGRTYSFARRVIHLFDFPYLIAFQNGADIAEIPSNKILQRNYLSAEIVPQIDHIYEGQKEDFIIYAGIDKGDFCYYRPERFSQKVLDYLKVLEGLSNSWQTSNFVFEKGVSFPLIKSFGEKKVMEELHHRLKGNPILEVSMIKDPIDPSLYLNLITDRQASKGHAVQFMKQHLKAPLVIAAGDDHNDLKMLQSADVAIAIETAPPEILAVSDILARPAEKCGIIQAVEVAIGRY